ncbi:MAG: ATPase involved in cell division [uncultured bacterium]|nr:MAG: ATPase involved in cell division [uncultured bacterium]
MSNMIAELLGVGHQYQDGPEVFKGVSFNIEKGSFRFLTGLSGSGKSSLLKVLYLGLKPRWGSVKLFGEDTFKMKPTLVPLLRQKIGVVFQEFNLLDHLTVIDNVSLPLRVRGVDEKRSHKHAGELLNWVGLGDCLKAYPPSLSGGQKQRAAIARAIITRPQLLLADEPTGNVDDEMATKLLCLFEELNKTGTAVLIATHNQRILKKFPYLQLTLKDGTLLQQQLEKKAS